MAIETSVWIYWLFCAIATIFVIAGRNFANPLLSPDSEQERKGYFPTLLLGWLATLLASGIYVRFTVKCVAGYYHLSDLMTFSTVNGVLEQFMFIFWFLLGCYVGQQKFKDHPVWIFICGYLSYVLYSGLIHPLFWFQVLPKHDPFMAMAFILPLMSGIWMWLFWRFRAVVAIVAMHIVIDFLSIGHLHFPWFEAFQS